MALRAMVVALLCIAVTHTFTLERSYWVFLTAFMLITQSFGDGIYRSLARFILTIIGCLLGWLIYLPLRHSPTGLFLASFIALFFMLYWFNTSLIGRNLATGILLVASFGMLYGGWTFGMLMARISDTFIGAMIAIIVNGLILPEFSKANVKNIFTDLRNKLLTLHGQLTQCKTLQSLKALQLSLQDLEKERLELSQSYQLARYELMFRRQRQEQYKSLLVQTNIVFSYINALLDIKITEHSHQAGVKKELAESGEAYYQTRLETELQKLAMI